VGASPDVLRFGRHRLSEEESSIRRSRWILATAAVVALVIAGGLIVALRRPAEPTAALPPPVFAAAPDIDHIYEGAFPFVVGGGVAAFDCDTDGRSDLFFAGGENATSLYRNESSVGGDLRFVEVTDPATALTEVTGAYPLDIDSDGLTDLAVLRFGENVLLRGLGDCRFERGNERWGFDGGDDLTTAFSARWESGAGMPSLAFGNYVTLDESGRQDGSCADNVFIPPDGATFGAAVPLSPGWCTLSMLFSNWDRSGTPDLRVTNDRHYYRDGEEQLWRIDAVAGPGLYTREEGWKKVQIWGMGIASHDVTGDGMPEVLLASMADNKLQTLEDGAGQPTYRDIAIRSGVTAHRPFTGGDVQPSTAWHAEFQDVNNDGFVDLFIAKGNVDVMPDFALQDPNNLLMGGPDGTFVEGAEAAGIVHFGSTRGAVVVDLNLDGLLDLVEVNRGSSVTVWRNMGVAGDTGTNWIAIKPSQEGANPDAIGAWLEVKVGDHVMQRELTVGGGHAGGQTGFAHFGLGPAEEARVRVQWPDGMTGAWVTVRANRFFVMGRGTGEAAQWSPR